MYNLINKYVCEFSHMTKERDKNNQLVKIYSTLLGYYSALKDFDIFNLLDREEVISDLASRLKSILKMDAESSLLNGSGSRQENMLHNINELFKSVDKKDSDTIFSAITEFLVGYDYYTEYHGKIYPIFNRFGIGSKKEKKLLELRNKLES